MFTGSAILAPTAGLLDSAAGGEAVGESFAGSRGDEAHPETKRAIESAIPEKIFCISCFIKIEGKIVLKKLGATTHRSFNFYVCFILAQRIYRPDSCW